MKPKNGFMTLMAVAAATVCIIAAIPTVSRSADDMELPNGGKVDLAAHCPVCGMIVGGDLGAGATYSYRNDRAVGFAGVAAVVIQRWSHRRV